VRTLCEVAAAACALVAIILLGTLFGLFRPQRANR